jgi:hypothetical protein
MRRHNSAFAGTIQRSRATRVCSRSGCKKLFLTDNGFVASYRIPYNSVESVLTTAIANLGKLVNTPRGQIVNRSGLLKEVETDLATLLEKVSDTGELVVQFDGSDGGKLFIEAWKRGPRHRRQRRAKLKPSSPSDQLAWLIALKSAIPPS